jgi:hypothetical protein
VESGFDSRQGQEVFLHSVQTRSGAHPESYSMGTVGSFPVCKARREANYLSPPSAEVNSGGAIPPLPHISSWNSA